MSDTVLAYFHGEKHAALLLIAAAIVGFVAAAVLFQARWGLRPLAVTLAVFAAMEIAIGVGLYVRTDPQVRELLARIDAGETAVFIDETARMRRVQRNFLVIQYVELACIVLGSAMAVALKRQPAVRGVALGIVIHAAFLLAFDLVAERRGAVYLSALERQSALES